LLGLTLAGFLRRFFLGTVGGARKALYALSQAGADLVGVPYRGPRRAADQILAADFFATHQLAINEIYCTLKFRTKPAEIELVRWLGFYEPVDGKQSLIPDGYAEIAIPGRSIAWFLEVDLGNESRAVWRRKVEAYVRLAVSGEFREKFRQPQFRTLVVANSERRLASLRTATATVTDKIFWFATFDAIEREGFWSAIWERPANGPRQSLF
jgi:hypothetical protein